MRPLGVHHVSVNVTDTARSVAFYAEALGGTVRDDRPELSVRGAWIDLGVAQVHLIEGSVPPALGQHFAILVDDLDEAVDELRAAGHEVSDPVRIGRGRQSFLRDPDGNVIELHQPSATLDADD